MTHIFRVQFIISLISIFHVGCTKEIEDLNLNRPLNNSSILCNSITCTFDSICLDYNLYDSVVKSELIGEWELIAYVDTSNCKTTIEPSNISQSIKLTFHENDSISGETVRNTYTGKYTINKNRITFLEVISTEIMEPKWGRKFSELIYFTDYIALNNNKLIIHSNEILIFRKQ